MRKTISSRIKIGFPTKAQFLKENAVYTEKTLTIAKHEIMQRWETNYMKKLASIACQNEGSILELGFGLGISAQFIQKYNHFQSKPKLKKHTIIEAHPEVCNYAKKMFITEIKSKKIRLLQGYWQDITKTLKSESFDGILFDTYPLREKEIHKNHFSFFKEAYRLLKKGGVLTYYSDESKTFSKEHLKKLKQAGFSNVTGQLCKVKPPKNSQYWRNTTILAPIVFK